MKPVEVKRGNLPLVLAMPHTGLYIPQEILDSFSHSAKQLTDTDWNVHRLYDSLLPDVTVVRALFHRYVIDANRDPSGTTLYSDQRTTALCPLTTFGGEPNYLPGREPDAKEISRRIDRFHAPYHNALKQEINLTRRRHGVAILYDCHSIRSRIPFLFASRLPDFNIGTNNGITCCHMLEKEIQMICERNQEYTTVVNGRFKGGWTTRHYGNPSKGIHAVQMELAQSTYMLEHSPWTYDESKSEQLRQVLAQILKALTVIAYNLSTSETQQYGSSSQE